MGLNALAMQDIALREAVSALMVAEGLETPSCFRMIPFASGDILVRYATGPDDYGINCERLENVWSVMDVGTIAPDLLERLHGFAHLAIRKAAQKHDKRLMPSWAVLAHPVLLAALFSHEPDRRKMPVRGDYSCDVPGGRWDIDHHGDVCHPGPIGNATADAWTAYGIMQAGSVGMLMRIGSILSAVTVKSVPYTADPKIGSTSISMATTLPETVLATIIGRRFGDVVGLPPCGHADVEAAGAECLITGYRQLPNGIEIEVGPTRLVPYGVPPTPELVRIMDLSPVIG